MVNIPSSSEIEDLIRAKYPLIYVVSPEEARVEKELKAIGLRRGRKFITWSITEGFVSSPDDNLTDSKDPLRALEEILKYESKALFILRDYHPFLKDPTIVRRLRDLGKELKVKKHGGKHVIMLSPLLKIPSEIEKELAVVDFDLPGREEIGICVQSLLKSLPPSRARKVREDSRFGERVVESALGLTLEEAENVFSKSIVRDGDFNLETILGEKKSIIRKSGILEFFESSYSFGEIGGLSTLKEWLSKRYNAFTSEARAFGLPLPKGILLIGVPGCGKSMTAKAVGAMWQVPLLRLDVGKVFASLVGSSEENIRKAIKTSEAVAPSILWLDELEKGFAGLGSSGMTDSGTTARVFGSFITWLQEKSAPVFVIATANDVSALPPEMLRKGRFDEIFFVDLPQPSERAEIFQIHIRMKKRDPAKFDIPRLVASTQGFSGSEIEQSVISAMYDAYDDHADIDTDRVVKSVQEIIPLSYTMKEKIDYLRDWARTRARQASPPKDVDLDDMDSDVRQLEV
ncbi:MAG: AAA family ATPase [Bradymonadales bacterium]|nr:AAA family ATPase [Bradymonadales bacterium]